MIRLNDVTIMILITLRMGKYYMKCEIKACNRDVITSILVQQHINRCELCDL